MTGAANSAQPDTHADLAATLADLDARYDRKTRLARILNCPTARRCIDAMATGALAAEAWGDSPFGRPALQNLWREVEALTATAVQLDSERLRIAIDDWTGGGCATDWIAQLLFGTEGVLPRARRESAFLTARCACAEQPTPQRVRELAQAAAAFAVDLRADARAFRRALHELRRRARDPLTLRVYGFGEISRTVGLVRHSTPLASPLAPQPVVHKRMPAFPRHELVEQYIRVYYEYNRRLRDDVGIAVPNFGHRVFTDARGWTVVSVTQALLDPRSVGKQILLQRDATQCLTLFRMVLDEYRKLVRYNARQAAAGFVIGLDGQIPNWAVRGYRGDDVPLRGDEGLIFVDTNTPMMRTHGRECLPMQFYLQSLPRMIRPFVRPMAKRVLDRYFNPRTILLDFLANTSIHGRGELVELFRPEGNAFLSEGVIQPAPPLITAHDVERYIADDVATWRLLRSARKIDEMLQGRRGPVETVRMIRQIYTQPIF